jgi:predicted O-methyltransferase YrrM
MNLPWLKKEKFEFKGSFSFVKDVALWTQFIPADKKPINYLEIGVLKGTNTLRVLSIYCSHPDSKIVCIDPWCDYNEYIEYKNQQNENYNDFLFNIEHSGSPQKYVIKRGFSEDIVPTLEDDFFDLIFIDGNHETEYVYHDGEMSLQKLKSGGHIVFDDYDWKETKEGINKFLEDYKDNIKIVGSTPFQLFIQKL